MLYFTAKADVVFLNDFKQKVKSLWAIEERMRGSFTVSADTMEGNYGQTVSDEITSSEQGKRLREEVAKGIPRAIEIARKNHIAISLQSYPAPAVGGAVIRLNIFSAILQDTSHGGIHHQWIEDKINETIGSAERRQRAELSKLFNPMYWLYGVLVFVVRIPFHLVSISGFNVSKVEDHFLGRLFKLAEIAVIVYVLIKLGIEKTALMDFLKTLVK
ncbi:MAG: hypothetical protein ISS70_22750 [Phycisphaerae bacterium]|nr:hypothetical protein [Phycisphaerae bacterium]